MNPLGIAAQAAAFVLGGLASILAGVKVAFAAVATAIGAMLSPIGLVVAAVAGLDNHWLDCLVGVAVAASIQGAVLFGTDAKPTPSRKRLKLSALQGERR